MFCEGMNGAISPDQIVHSQRGKELGGIRKRPSDRIQYEAGMECADKRDIDIQSWRVLDFGDLHSIHFFPLILRHQVDLFHSVAEAGALKAPFKAGEASALVGPVRKHFSADSSRENATYDKGSFCFNT